MRPGKNTLLKRRPGQTAGRTEVIRSAPLLFGKRTGFCLKTGQSVGKGPLGGLLLIHPAGVALKGLAQPGTQTRVLLDKDQPHLRSMWPTSKREHCTQCLPLPTSREFVILHPRLWRHAPQGGQLFHGDEGKPPGGQIIGDGQCGIH